jgi:hypothetical protein
MADRNLPPVGVPEDFYELIRLYAFQSKLSISAAMRQLLKESPGLIALADKEGVDLAGFTVGSWGGDRKGEVRDRVYEERNELDKIGEILADLSQQPENQIDAINKLLQAKPRHRAHVCLLLRKGLEAHLTTYGPIQEAIVRALGQLEDVNAIHGIEVLKTITDDPNVQRTIDAALAKLKARQNYQNG